MSGGLTIGGDTSGSVALVPAAIAGSTTITIAAQSGTLNVAGPAFSAYGGSQSIANSTWTKIALASEEFDTASCFDTSNYKFTPNVAGYYWFNLKNQANAFSNLSYGFYSAIYKNGTVVKSLCDAMSSGVGLDFGGSALIYANGTTDYFEFYVWQYTGGGSYSINPGPVNAFCQGYLARSA